MLYRIHVYVHLCREQNINTGHSEGHSNDESLAIQTPAVNFILLNHTVSNYHMKFLSMCKAAIYIFPSSLITCKLIFLIQI